MRGGKRHHGARCLPRAAGALPGDNCPFSHCPPLPGDTVDPSCVTGKLWLLSQRSLHCLSAERGLDAWSRSGEACHKAAAPARTPRCREFSCSFATERRLPGSSWDRRSSGTRCYFWLPSFRCWVGTVRKRLRSHPVALLAGLS